MHTKDAIRFALTLSNGAVLSVIDEMSGAATTFPTPNGGCHPLWVLGHLTLVEGMIPAVFFGDKNPAAEWQQYFARTRNRSPMPAHIHPLPRFERSIFNCASRPEASGVAKRGGLDKPTKAPPKGREQEFATYGQSFLVLALHQTMHRGT